MRGKKEEEEIEEIEETPFLLPPAVEALPWGAVRVEKEEEKEEEEKSSLLSPSPFLLFLLLHAAEEEEEEEGLSSPLCREWVGGRSYWMSW